MNRILLIDDDSAANMLVSAFLRQEGFEVLEAFNGEDGLALALMELPDLVVCDLEMPDLHGFEVLRRFRQGGGEPRSR